MKIKITFLGSGTSHGVPKMNCGCDVCKSDDPRDKRLRSSILIEYEGKTVLVDTSTDLRRQALDHSIKNIDSIIFTHAHADHLHGIDEIRVYQTKASEPIKCYGTASFCEEVKRRFDYVFFEKMPVGGGTPRITINDAGEGFELFGLLFEPLPVVHGEKTTIGYRFSNVAYIPDVKTIPETTLEKMKGLEVLIIDALRHRPHSTHFSFTEAIEIVRVLKPSRAYFTHIDHEISHARESAALASAGLPIEIAYDGLVVEVMKS